MSFFSDASRWIQRAVTSLPAPGDTPATISTRWSGFHAWAPTPGEIRAHRRMNVERGRMTPSFARSIWFLAFTDVRSERRYALPITHYPLRALRHEEPGKIVHSHDRQLRAVARLKYAGALLRREPPREGGIELGGEHRSDLLASPRVTDGILDLDLRRLRAVLEVHLHRVRARALLRIHEISAVALVLDHDGPGTQRVDARVGRHVVLEIPRGEAPEDEAHRDDVLGAVIPVGGIGERAGLVHDAHQGFLAAELDPLDVADAVLYQRVQPERAFHRRLAVHAGSHELEHRVADDVLAVGPLKPERPALVARVVESVLLRGHHRGIAHLALDRHEREPQRLEARVGRGPALAPPGVGRLPERRQAGLHPRVRHGIDDLLAPAAEHARQHGTAGHAGEEVVVYADRLEIVLDGDAALDLVGLDEALEYVAHRQRLTARGCVAAGEVIGQHQDAGQVIARVAALRRGESVVVVEPADHAAEAERRGHRVELVGRAGYARAVRDDRAGHHRADELGAVRVVQCVQRAGDRVRHAEPRGRHRLGGPDLVADHVVGDVGQDFVGRVVLALHDYRYGLWVMGNG